MGKLTEEQQRQLDELTALQNAQDDDSEFEIEIWNEKGQGARIPYGKGRSWLQSNFGIDMDPPPAEPDPNAATDPEGGQRTGAAGRYFGGQRGNKQPPGQ
jgi:hypothetical protein